MRWAVVKDVVGVCPQACPFGWRHPVDLALQVGYCPLLGQEIVFRCACICLVDSIAYSKRTSSELSVGLCVVSCLEFLGSYHKVDDAVAVSGQVTSEISCELYALIDVLPEAQGFRQYRIDVWKFGCVQFVSHFNKRAAKIKQ